MNIREAHEAVKAMYAAHGFTKPPEVTAQLAGEIMASACHPCAARVVGMARDEGTKPLTVPAFRAAYRNEYASPDHQAHIGYDDATNRAATAERFWHHDVVRHLGGGLDAEFVAARMWASEAVGATLDDVDAARAAFATGPRPDEGLVDASWTFAREIARNPPARMSDGEWLACVGPFEREWNRCQGASVS